MVRHHARTCVAVSKPISTLDRYAHGDDARISRVDGGAPDQVWLKQQRQNWHDSEDEALDSLSPSVSGSLDRCGTLLVTAIPRGWLVAGLACLAQEIAFGQSSVDEHRGLPGSHFIGLCWICLKRLTG